jgi:hypothetical protein
MNEQTQQHFVGYHNVDVRGRALWRGREGWFDTGNRKLPKKGDILWCFEGEERPKRFRLVKRAVVSYSEKGPDGSEVHYDVSDLLDVAVNGLPWFVDLLREQASFARGVSGIGNREIVDALERLAAARSPRKAQFTDLCAYTLKHSSDLETFADGRDYTIETGGKPWARIAEILSAKEPEQTVAVLFAPAEHFAKVTACAELVRVKTLKSDGVNSFTFRNFRYLSPPILKSSLRWYNGNPLGDFQRDYAICRTPANLAGRLILTPSSEADDIAEIDQNPTIPETTRKELRDARRGQGKYRSALDDRWDHACAVTRCSLRDLLLASHVKPWRSSDHVERLDPANGILLMADIDILFDKGYISFDDDGRMLVSSRLPAAEQRLLGLPRNLKKKLTSGERRYLAHHRVAYGFPA